MAAGQGHRRNNEIPYKPEALAQRKSNDEHRATEDLATVSCPMPPGPRATYAAYLAYPFHIAQDCGAVAIRYQFYQFAHTLRIIHFDGLDLSALVLILPERVDFR